MSGTRPLHILWVLSLALLLCNVPDRPANARSCAAEPVTARGEVAATEWLAKLKARANWRRKVRAMQGLGASYADWSKAEAATERCIATERSVYCIFTGLPCGKRGE